MGFSTVIVGGGDTERSLLVAKAQVARIAVPVVVLVIRISILKDLEALLLLLLGFPGLRF